MLPRIYTYKITFEEVPFWYWGVHTERKFGENYLGSPKTHAWAWDFYTPQKQILEVFQYSEEGWKQALSVEDRLILPDLNNPLCLNERCNVKASIKSAIKGAHSQSIEGKKKGGSVAGKITGPLVLSLGLGIHAEQYKNSSSFTEDRKRGGQRGASVSNSQKWRSTEDGFISTAGNVAKHNRDNGWDPNARVKVS
jgi:hypothetical protein